ncbi:MBL fold metallo-hydrolase [Streptomyces sp. NPDC093568]|uniref:MBL fold metallo-hydrolase n=1 Tax=Streptomyces sp. NPDC093568 TaxID=3366041 RepID=UPI0037F714DA
MTPPLQQPPNQRRPVPLSRRGFARAAALALTAGAGAGLTPPALASAATRAEAQEYYTRARTLAGDDPVLLTLVKALTPGAVVPRPPAPEPLRIFDNVAMLSVGWVSAMAVLTDEGIALIDALTSPEEAESTIVGGLRTLGADPRKIKYVIVTHGHDDHFGGAQYLADRYGARVLMTPTDWNLATAATSPHAPTRDLDITDGQRLRLGDTTISLHHTPGHTPGTVSPIFPVHTGHTHHKAMLWGGTNPPTTPTALRTYLTSIKTFRTRMHKTAVDVELSNHPNDYGLQRAEQLRDNPHDPNPFILGTHRTQRYMRVMTLMLRGRLAESEERSERRRK